MDYLCNTDNFVAVGVGEQLHDGGIYSHFACNSNYCGAGQSH